MTLFSITDGKGQEHSCDSRCYDAKGPICNCPCGGKNHGQGIHQAMKNTAELVANWVEEFEKKDTVTETYIADQVLQKKG